MINNITPTIHHLPSSPQLRAAIRTFMPKEEKFMQVEQKFKRQVFIANVNRLKACVMDLVEGGKFIK